MAATGGTTAIVLVGLNINNWRGWTVHVRGLNISNLRDQGVFTFPQHPEK